MTRLLARFNVAIWMVVTVLPVCGQEDASTKESVVVARDVVARGDWLADAERCPTAVMPKRQFLDYLRDNRCQLSQGPECLARCSAGEPAACYWLGQRLEVAGVDSRASRALYQRSCKLGIVSGCTNSAAAMSLNEADSSPIQTCAFETFARGCEFDDPWACSMHALHLVRGLGVRPDTVMALKSLSKACKYGSKDEACQYGMAWKKEIAKGAFRR